MHDHYVERIDLLTGCGNLLSFLETLSDYLAETPSERPFSLLLLDLNRFMEFNSARGREQGDNVLRWVSIVLRDTGLPVYRLSGDEFIVILTEGSLEARDRLARATFQRLQNESAQFDWPDPASLILIHFQPEKLDIADIWMAISDALFDAKIYGERGFLVNAYSHAAAGNDYHSRLINMLAERLLSFVERLDTAHQLAYVDPTTQLPNSLAAESELEQAVRKANETNGAFSILFIDGDNLRLYNTISYSAGDQMIRDLAETLARSLRPGDFIARWRVGDEFLVILPRTSSRRALAVAERIRSAVENESKAWQFPVTVSIGAASFPVHGRTAHDLLQQAESAAKFAKESGKNQVVGLPAG
jgi:diguanylate cyclase (GGDEF)-like protein